MESIMQAKATTSVMIEVRDVRAGYKNAAWLGAGQRVVVVDGLSFSLSRGEIAAIVAGNACGKSTVIRAVVDQRSRWSGEVLCDGRVVGYGQIAYVPQNPALSLSPWKTVLEELCLPLAVRGIRTRTASARVEKMLCQLGITLPLNRPVEQLSGGQRVKVAVARGLIVPDAKLIVLDEPFEGLDEDARHSLVEVLLKVSRSGLGILLTSHRNEDLAALGARILRPVGSPITSLRAETSVDQVARHGTDRDQINPCDVSRRSTETPRRWQAALVSTAIGATGIVSGLLIWHLCARLIGNASILPPPGNVLGAAGAIFTSPERLGHVLATLGRAIGCWLGAMLVAVPLGVVVGSNSRVFRFLAPWLSLGRCVPVFALAGAVIGLFPQMPEFQRLFLIWLTLFLISLQIVSLSAAVATRRRWDFARIIGATWWYRLWRVLLWESVGGIVSSLEVTLPTAIIVTFVVETTLLPQNGLGTYVFNHLTDNDLSVMYAYLLIPGLVAAIGVWAIRIGSSTLRREL